jgi:predicted CoA-binding protein
MTDLTEAVDDFLAQKIIAVAGVSRKGDIPANVIYRRLRDAGYEVYPVNPNATEVEGTTCFPDLGSIPAEVQGVVIATPPSAAPSLVEACVAQGIPRVWMHRSFGRGSVSEEAREMCRTAGITLIPGACPMMFLEPVDVAHKCIRWFLGATRKLPAPEGSLPPP